MSRSIRVHELFFFGVLISISDHFAPRLTLQFLCLKSLGAEKLSNLKIPVSLPNVSTADESSLFFGNHHYYLDVDFDWLTETLRNIIGDVKNAEAAS